MKTRIIFFLSVLVLFLVAADSSIFGQTAASITWYLDQADSTIPTIVNGPLTGQPITGSPLKDNVQFVIRSYTGSFAGEGPIPGITTSMRWWPVDGAGTAVSWGSETGQNNDRYVQLQAAPNSGFSWHIDTLSIWLAGGGTSYVRARIYWSTDPDFIINSELTPTDTGMALPHATDNTKAYFGIHQFAYNVNVTVNEGQSLYFRIYPWYTASPSTSKYLYTQYAYFSGTTSPVTDVKQLQDVPKVFSLSQNYPNPFNPATSIKFSLDKAGMTNLAVYNMLGQRVADLINSNLSAGDHNVSFNADNLTSGIYIYQLTSGGKILSRKMILLK